MYIKVIVIHIHVSILFQALSPFRLLQNIEQSFLCYTAGPCWDEVLSYLLSFSCVTCRAQGHGRHLSLCWKNKWEHTSPPPHLPGLSKGTHHVLRSPMPLMSTMWVNEWQNCYLKTSSSTPTAESPFSKQQAVSEWGPQPTSTAEWPQCPSGLPDLRENSLQVFQAIPVHLEFENTRESVNLCEAAKWFAACWIAVIRML